MGPRRESMNVDRTWLPPLNKPTEPFTQNTTMKSATLERHVASECRTEARPREWSWKEQAPAELINSQYPAVRNLHSPSDSPPPLARPAPISVLPTQGEIEAAICAAMSRCEQEYMGRGPKDIRAHLIGDLLMVRLQGVLTAAERHLVTTLPAEKGRDLLKQVRSQLIETARPALEALVQDITGIKPRSLHHDISTRTDEEVVIFTLSATPRFRETNKK